MSSGFGTSELLNAYRRGVFPMADSRDDPNLFLIDPDERALLPLLDFHIPKRLKRTVRKMPFRVSVNECFVRVIEACAASNSGRETTWINSAIVNLYSSLHRKGFAHSIECWDGDELVGGLYGVSLGAAFFGESMFSTRTDASKIALVHLVARLLAGGYQMLDAQFHNPHLDQFGLQRIQRKDFKRTLAAALANEGDFYSPDAPVTGKEALQRITQIS
ncbi:MAG: leucyl/phenylalanyl-tRNA--protein transferase [Hyphomonadaceae bacterium]